MNKEILELIKEKGLLLEKSVFDVLDSCSDAQMARKLLERFEMASGQKIITFSSMTKNFSFVQEIVRELPGETKNLVEKTLVKLGVSLEVQKESIVQERDIGEHPSVDKGYKIFYSTHDNEKKIEVSDFVGHFRARYQQIQRILMQRSSMEKLTSINKIPMGTRQSFTLIGMVREKRITKNRNLIIVFEDLTGRISALVKAEGECFSAANELQLDDIVAVKCSGSKEMVFAHEIIYPDAFAPDKPRFEEDACIAFVSDIHCGSKNHLGKQFERFLAWIKSDDPLARKIKYLFFVGDNVDGVGVFPGQERLLELTSLRQQYELLASYLREIPSSITMFMCPGQHDSVRVPEPQPVIDNYYGAPLYDIPNLVLVSNPTLVKLNEGSKEFKILMYHGASIHNFINSIEELRTLKAHRCPAKAVKHMLKRRHLAPTHSSVVYVPNAVQDPLVIGEVPHIFCTGEVHRLDIEKYNGVMIITGSCWQSQTEFEEKVGNIPDPCKVPIFNLKSHELKILDFTGDDNNEN